LAAEKVDEHKAGPEYEKRVEKDRELLLFGALN
jgi:hypothetical protein